MSVNRMDYLADDSLNERTAITATSKTLRGENRVRIETGLQGRGTKVFINDVEQRFLTDIDVSFSPSSATRVTLTYLVTELVIQGEAEVEKLTQCGRCREKYAKQ